MWPNFSNILISTVAHKEKKRKEKKENIKKNLKIKTFLNLYILKDY